MKNLRRTASPVRKNRRAAENPRQTAAGRTRIPYTARILATELGGLRLGMKREDVRAMLGEPDSTNNAGEIQRGGRRVGGLLVL